MALPPTRPPPKPGAPLKAPPPAAEDALAKSKREKDELEEDTGLLEDELEELKAKYEQYFLGVERQEPWKRRDELRKRILRVKEAFTRNTGLRFRIQSLHARYLSYERLWMRSAREREEGTYRRDLFKARLHAGARHKDDPKKDARRAEPQPQAQPPAPAPAAPPPLAAAGQARPPGATPVPGARQPPVPPRPAAPAAGAGAMAEAQLRQLYDAYVSAKRKCNEDVSRITYDALASTVTKQIPELMTRFKAKSVEFKVEVKDGKAVLKAIPKV